MASKDAKKTSKKPGPAPKFSSPEELEAKINEFFQLCEKEGKFPSEAAMCVYLDISRDTLERYMREERDIDKGFAEPIKKARTRREALLVDEIYAATGKDVTGKIFLSKQPSNGGLSDRHDINANQDIKINVKLSFDGK